MLPRLGVGRSLHSSAVWRSRPNAINKYMLQLKQRYPSADPPSLLVSFLLLHELTAIVPLAISFFSLRTLGVGAGLVGWAVAESSESEGAEDSWAKGKLRGWVVEGERKAERVGRRYGAFGYSKETADEHSARRSQVAELPPPSQATPVNVSGDVANLVASYLLVKALLPLRILVSLRMAPPMANVISKRFSGLRAWGAELLKRREG